MDERSKKVPHKSPRKLRQRTCVSCRRSGDKGPLLRFVASDGKLVWDKNHNATGRGAYLHSNRECISKMGSTRLWERVLRLETGTLEPAKLDKLRELVLE